MGQPKNGHAASLLVGTFVNEDGKVRFHCKGKDALNVRSEWYEGTTFTSHVGHQVVVLGVIAPSDEIAIRAIFGLVTPTAADKGDEKQAAYACDSDVTLCYTWML